MSSYRWLLWLALFGWCCMDTTGHRIRISIDSSLERDIPPNGRVSCCTDHIKNQDETDVDCGGIKCPKCRDTRSCNTDCDCISDICKNKRCAPMESCTDNIKNQNETDVDCGGTMCQKCEDTKNCNRSSDCFSGYCRNNVCSPTGSCADNIKNQDETDVDCGGTRCPKCGNTKSCNQSSDCISGYCKNNMCDPAESCGDNIKNQDETDVDCGGIKCPKCGNTKNCNQSSDCISGYCKNNVCGPVESCADNIKNQDETDVDCGGTKCSKCGNTQNCNQSSDCISNFCNNNHICTSTISSTSLTASPSSSPIPTAISSDSTSPSTISPNTTAIFIRPSYPVRANVTTSVSNYYGTERASVFCERTLTTLNIVITVQKTVGARWTGMFNNFPGGTMSESHTDNGAQVIYTWTIINGQTIGPSENPYTAVAQFDLIGTAQSTSGDIYRIAYMTSDGRTGILTGHF